MAKVFHHLGPWVLGGLCRGEVTEVGGMDGAAGHHGLCHVEEQGQEGGHLLPGATMLLGAAGGLQENVKKSLTNNYVNVNVKK